MIKIPIYTTPEEAFEKFTQNRKNDFLERIKQLPDEELPHVELRVRKLYFETYYLCALDFHNATIVMCGVLCEALLKELIYDKERRELTEIVGEKIATFGTAINYCLDKKYITEEEANWFKNIKNIIRDLYQHSNVKKIVKSSYGGEPYYRAQKIEIPENVKGEELLKLMRDAIKNPKPNTFISGRDIRSVYDVQKSRIDEIRSLPLFLDVDKFLRKFAEKYFKHE
jgi:hypothetical protein